MKKLTAFAALAALVSSVSIASAQGSMQPGTSGGGSSAGSTAGAFCLNQQGALNCRYQSMAACQQAAGASGDCVPNPNRATTGSGSGGSGGTSRGGSGSMGGGSSGAPSR